MRLVLLVVVFSVMASGCSQINEDTPAPDVYDQSCARCHGADLSGNIGPPLNSGSPAAEKSDDSLRTAIRQGRGRMPSFGNQLTEQQIDDLVSLIREAQLTE